MPSVMFQQVDCIEVCNCDRLIGYAIYFSGGWDAYSFRNVAKSMAIKVGNCLTQLEAIERIEIDWGLPSVCRTDCGDGSTVYDSRPRPGA